MLGTTLRIESPREEGVTMSVTLRLGIKKVTDGPLLETSVTSVVGIPILDESDFFSLPDTTSPS